MASVAKRPDGRWRARFRDHAGQERARHFDRKVDATRWLAEVTTAVTTGQYIDPATRRTTVGQYAAAWQDTLVLRSNSARNYDVILRRHVVPHLGDRPLVSVRPTDVQALVKTLSGTLAPSTVGQVVKVVRQLFGAAVDDRLIAVSPAAKVKAPRNDRPEIVVPTVDDVVLMAGAVPVRHRGLVMLLAGSGLRIGEALGLEVGDVDFLRRTVRVERQRLPDGTIGPPKTASSVRTVPLGQVVVDELAAHLARLSGIAQSSLFTNELGRPLQYKTWQKVWRSTADPLGVGCSSHDLRHFCASALIAGGATVKQVQAVLGHGSAALTLTTYSHLWPGDDDRTRAVMDAVLGAPADRVRTEGVVVE